MKMNVQGEKCKRGRGLGTKFKGLGQQRIFFCYRLSHPPRLDLSIIECGSVTLVLVYRCRWSLKLRMIASRQPTIASRRTPSPSSACPASTGRASRISSKLYQVKVLPVPSSCRPFNFLMEIFLLFQLAIEYVIFKKKLAPKVLKFRIQPDL